MQQAKTVLITGATKGIGRATAELLSEQGVQVIGIARHAPNAGQLPDNHQINEDTTSFPGTFYACDLADPAQTQACLATITQAHKIDAVVNNAGLVLAQTFEETDLASLRAVYDVNVRAALQVAQACVPHMKTQGWGRIVNVASRAMNGAVKRTSYAAAKAALVGFTRTWALELASHHITVNAVAPGPIETALFRENRPQGSADAQHLLQRVPLKRIGQPEEVAAAIVFLLSEGAGYITGQTLCVDGGLSI